MMHQSHSALIKKIKDVIGITNVIFFYKRFRNMNYKQYDLFNITAVIRTKESQNKSLQKNYSVNQLKNYHHDNRFLLFWWYFFNSHCIKTEGILPCSKYSKKTFIYSRDGISVSMDVTHTNCSSSNNNITVPSDVFGS